MSETNIVARPFDGDRPNIFKNVVGNKTVLKRLTGMLANNRLSQVIFLTGPIGSGKTTTARIVARAKFCKRRQTGEYEPCGTCSMCEKAINDATCAIAEYHEYGGEDVTEATLDNFTSMLQRPWDVIFIDELQDMKPELLRRFRKMIEGTKATVLLATTHPGEIEEAVRSRLQSYEYLITRPTIEEAADFLEAQCQRFQVSFGSPSESPSPSDHLHNLAHSCLMVSVRFLSTRNQGPLHAKIKRKNTPTTDCNRRHSWPR